MSDYEKLVNELLHLIGDQIIEKHKTCLTDQFDNGYFWGCKDMQSFILKEFKEHKE